MHLYIVFYREEKNMYDNRQQQTELYTTSLTKLDKIRHFYCPDIICIISFHQH